MVIKRRKHLRNRKGKLLIESASASALARAFGTPLYVYSELRIRQNYERLNNALIRHIPNITIAYSLKANANSAILDLLQTCGAAGDCASLDEIKKARNAKLSEVIYTGVFASKEEIKKASTLCDVLVLNDKSHLSALRGSKSKGVLALRVNPGSGRGSHPGVITGGNTKFGIPLDSLVDAYKEASAMGFVRFGLHMMTGSGVTDWHEFITRTKTTLQIAKKIEDKVNITIETVDIGGGFGIPYKKDESVLDVKRMAKGMGDVYKRITKNMRSNPCLIVEPGRYIIGDAGILLTSVTAVKMNPKRYVGVDAGMHTFVRPAMYGSYHEVLAAGDLNARNLKRAIVVGQICETTDVLAKDRKLPEVKDGDILAILDVGAYGSSMSSRYGNRGFPKEAMVSGKNYRNITE